MSERVTEERIRELVRELEPVRPIPRLRTVGAVVLASGALAFAADWLAGGHAPRALGDVGWVSPPFLGTLFGIALVAFGASSAALASSVPGRGETESRGWRVTELGFGLALLGWALGVGLGAGDRVGESAGAIFACGLRAMAVGIVPAIVCAVFVSRAAVRRASVSAALSLAGGVAIGAVAVQATCASNSPLHQLVGHALAPLFAAVVLCAPAALLMSRWARRR